MKPGDEEALLGAPRVRIELDAPLAITLLGLLQLCQRHPALSGNALAFARSLAADLVERLSLTPNLRAICLAGDNPEHDERETGSRIILPGG